MGTPMHFRKRQLLEYQIEANSSHPNEHQENHINEHNYSYINEPQIIYEYPLSPSSMGSEKSTPIKCDKKTPGHNSTNANMSPSSMGSENSTPTKCDNTNPGQNSTNANKYSTEQMQILAKNTVALLEMENLSPKSSEDAQKLTQIAESLTALENFAHDANVDFAGSGRKLTYDTSTLIHFAYNLKQTIEEYIKQEISNASANKSSLSTLILAKLNQLRVNALLQPNQCVKELPYDRAYCSSEQELDLVAEDLSLKRNEHDYHSTLEEPSPEEDIDFEESNLVIDESYVEMHSEDDDFHRISENTKLKNRYTRQGLHQIATRISGIFTFINRTQTRMEELMRQGINVYEKATHASSKSKKKSLSSRKLKKSSTPPSSSLVTQASKNVPNNNNPPKSFNLFNQISKENTISKELPINNTSKPLNVYKPKPWTNGLGDDKKYNTNYPIPSPYEDNMLIIGLNGTKIPKTEWVKIDWEQTPPAITRKILMILFDREFLATHSLTGRPSPAFLDLNYPEKKPLDTKIVADLVDLVTSRTIATAKEVRMAITTKCADESKMRRCRETKHFKQNENLRMKPY